MRLEFLFVTRLEQFGFAEFAQVDLSADFAFGEPQARLPFRAV